MPDYEHQQVSRTIKRNGIPYTVDVTLTRAVHTTGGGLGRTSWSWLPLFGGCKVTPPVDDDLRNELVAEIEAEANRA